MKLKAVKTSREFIEKKLARQIAEVRKLRGIVREAESNRAASRVISCVSLIARPRKDEEATLLPASETQRLVMNAALRKP
jgi:hypothetical protein